MWIEKGYHLKSSCPMLMHNGQTADPMNKFSKALKQVTAKRTKTDEDREEMARIEFMAGLYMGEDGPVIPSGNLESMLIEGAKKTKEGNQAKAGMYVKEHAKLIYKGTKDPEKLYEDDYYRDTRSVVVQRSRIMRTRPIFRNWEADITVVFENTVTNESRVDDWVKIAGNIVGLGDMRPRMGRFEVL